MVYKWILYHNILVFYDEIPIDVVILLLYHSILVVYHGKQVHAVSLYTSNVSQYADVVSLIIVLYYGILVKYL